MNGMLCNSWCRIDCLFGKRCETVTQRLAVKVISEDRRNCIRSVSTLLYVHHLNTERKSSMGKALQVWKTAAGLQIVSRFLDVSRSVTRLSRVQQSKSISVIDISRALGIAYSIGWYLLASTTQRFSFDNEMKILCLHG